ncbi:MAG TPA: hypothetical protein VNJ05_07470 [Sphingomicrobium sp.]|nr:hypothetical protein [Sphingomicrobium sp.]
MAEFPKWSGTSGNRRERRHAVARYYFHLRDGHDLIMDPEGREIDDGAQIPLLVLKDARSMISQDALAGRIQLGLSIDVLDESGKVVHHLSFRDALTISD